MVVAGENGREAIEKGRNSVTPSLGQIGISYDLWEKKDLERRDGLAHRRERKNEAVKGGRQIASYRPR